MVTIMKELMNKNSEKVIQMKKMRNEMRNMRFEQ